MTLLDVSENQIDIFEIQEFTLREIRWSIVVSEKHKYIRIERLQRNTLALLWDLRSTLVRLGVSDLTISLLGVSENSLILEIS